MRKHYKLVKFDKVISIGSYCEVAKELIKYNLRSESLPFDWLWTSLFYIHKSLVDKTQFHFLKHENLKPTYDKKYTHTYFYIKDEYQRLEAIGIHDADNIPKKQLKYKIPEINEKYNRRYNRLIDILNSKKNVVLIRYANPTYSPLYNDNPRETYKDIVKLYDMIMNMYDCNLYILFITKDKNELRKLKDKKIDSKRNIYVSNSLKILKNIKK